jgi:hypothetical protein
MKIRFQLYDVKFPNRQHYPIEEIEAENKTEARREIQKSIKHSVPKFARENGYVPTRDQRIRWI